MNKLIAYDMLAEISIDLERAFNAKINSMKIEKDKRSGKDYGYVIFNIPKLSNQQFTVVLLDYQMEIAKEDGFATIIDVNSSPKEIERLFGDTVFDMLKICHSSVSFNTWSSWIQGTNTLFFKDAFDEYKELAEIL